MPVIQFQPILANLRHFAPHFTYTTSKYTFFVNFFVYITWVQQGVVTFKISLSAHNFYTYGHIKFFFVARYYIFCHIYPSIQICFYLGSISRKNFPMDKIWDFRQNPAFIFIFWYKYTQLGLLLTYRTKNKFLTIQLNENVLQHSVQYQIGIQIKIIIKLTL